MDQNEDGMHLDEDPAPHEATVVLGQFLLLLIQAFINFPELFGFASTPRVPSSFAMNDWSFLEPEYDETLASVLVTKSLCLCWLIYDVLDNYSDGYKWWVKPRSTAWFYEFLMGYYGDDKWIENMRMTRATFGELCELLGPSIIMKDTHYRRAIPVFARVGAAVYKLTPGDGFGKVFEKFAMGKTSARRVLHEVCLALGEQLGHMISLPSGQELIEVMNAFHVQCDLPNIAGVIDVTHIYITAPNTPFYRDYHKFKNYSICLQAVCDSSWRFRDIYVGMPGSVNDTRVLKYSSLWDMAHRRAIFSEGPMTLPWRVHVHPFLLADLGYPVLSWLITHVRHLDAQGFVTREEERFNMKHRVGRRHVEQSFGLLKNIFHEMGGGRSDLSVVDLPMVVRACCILQNFMIEKQENDFVAILREWEMESAADGINDLEEEILFIQRRAYILHRNLVDEELEGLASTCTLVAYLSADAPRVRRNVFG